MYKIDILSKIFFKKKKKKKRKKEEEESVIHEHLHFLQVGAQSLYDMDRHSSFKE